MKTEFSSCATAKPVRVLARVPAIGLQSCQSPDGATSALDLRVNNRDSHILNAALQAADWSVAPDARKGRDPFYAPNGPALALPRLVLRGDPALLRRLRADEMAAWKEPALPLSTNSDCFLGLSAPAISRVETLLLLALAAAAGIAVLLGLIDVHKLLVDWTRFAVGINKLLC